MKSSGETRRRRIILLGVFCVIIIIIIVLVRSCGNDSSVQYVFAKVEKGDVVRTVYVTGRTDLGDAIMVKSDISGIIKNVYVKINDFVKKGTVLAEIDAPDLNFNAQQTRETLTQMTITLDAAKEALIAKESLFKENLVAEKEYTAAKRDYDRALSAYRQTKNNMDKINQDLINRIVRSTVAGQVIQVFGVPFAAVGKGTDLFQITANIKKMTLVLNVDESDIGIVSVGKPVEFTVSAYQDKKFTGKITTISTTPIMQGNIVTYSTLGECDNSSLQLKPGMSVTASIFVNKVGSVLRIPNEAFSISPEFTESTPGKKFVWKRKKTLGAGDAEDMVRVEVTTGLSGNGYTQFVSGKLKEGDEVLVKIKRQQKGKSIPGL